MDFLNRDKRIITILIMFTIIFTFFGASLAYLNWETSESQKTNIVFTLKQDFWCAADGGGDITQDNAFIAPSKCTSSTHAIKRKVVVTPTILRNGLSINMDLWLDINLIDSGLSKSDNFKYALTTNENSCTEDVIISGTFKGTSSGSQILILNKNYNASLPEIYYLYVWLDEMETSPSTMDQNFSLSFGGKCIDDESRIKIFWDGKSMEVPEITDNYWEIKNSAQLYFLTNVINNGLTDDVKEMLLEKGYDEEVININSDTIISLNENLYLQNHEWTPIGINSENSFMGVFEGNGHFVSGVNISSDTNPVGIFGYVTGEINDLTIKDSSVEATGTNNAGGIVGYLADTGEITNCHNVNTEVKGNSSVGGIAGISYGDIYKSTSSGTITGNGSQAGGITGATYKTIQECVNTGAVNVIENSAGGIVGRIGDTGKVISCKNTGDITANSTGTANTFTGGIAGIVIGHVEKSSNYGNILSQTSARWNRAGGIAAALGTSSLNASITECSNFGNVGAIGSSTYLALAGGIVGDTTNKVIITSCYNTGNVIGTKVQYSYVGGILGRVQGVINMQTCYSKGEINNGVVASIAIAQGGIIGKMNGSYDGINNVYYYDTLDNNIGAIAGKDSVAYNAIEVENIFDNFDEFNLWLTTNNSN